MSRKDGKHEYPCTINSTVHRPVLEKHILDCMVGAVATERANGKTMRREAAEAILSDDVASTVDHRYTVISVMAIISIDGDVLTR